ARVHAWPEPELSGRARTPEGCPGTTGGPTAPFYRPSRVPPTDLISTLRSIGLVGGRPAPGPDSPLNRTTPRQPTPSSASAEDGVVVGRRAFPTTRRGVDGRDPDDRRDQGPLRAGPGADRRARDGRVPAPSRG